MADRMTRHEHWSMADLVVTNTVAFEKGEMACIDTSTGLVTVGAVSATLKPIGYFFTSGTGDGTTKHPIRLFREIRLDWWENAAGGDAVDAADIGSSCYINGDRQVAITATGRSVAGTVWAVNSRYGVLVEMATSV